MHDSMSQITTFQEFRKRYPFRVTEATLLGSGTYGKVVKVEDQVETEWVAVKISEFKGDDAGRFGPKLTWQNAFRVIETLRATTNAIG
ncbi:hypothetical protein [Spirosoma telluris]|uniref:hypothetical protein n=1 Tax=Spirosoma telluris TaxID=2183553 RepID=UPI002FC3D227